ncbi:fumarylacetoacetate hydrolase [Subtercola boreus]|uniref:Fumarylacetoacetate hydrolase n=1 Tax=Subtercola boreus TaxID=120213 RepID=A0A3E0VHJ9_9MICO|nr:fumarylacetoacetate hydrolase family protein [Subtercola boreus]RFA08850.1 fumarylacetoacetate hydrolase [Subtercola boreus]TQL54177.1 2-keto-4-pentenoate hydratase/2-oxohepta-3-ene-1,7-dioic acid hydratase in catechol pathway [Subtercola boreus]
MRIANLSGRLVIVEGDHALDVERASSGAFSSDPQGVYARWEEFVGWATSQDASSGEPFEASALGAAIPRPAQVFAIGLNYASHADESGFEAPKDPVVFTKFVSSFAGPDIDVELPGDTVDWEAELVAVIGTGGTDISEDDAWSHIAGLSVGQDLSDRTVQFWGHPPQFSLGKSRTGFSPVGPSVVTLDEIDTLADRSDLSVRCTLTRADGSTEVLQNGRTRDMIFSIPTLVARLSAVLELLPGDVIFTGTPAGVGHGRTPRLYLRAGDVLTTEIEAVGTIVQRFAGRP